MSASDAPPRVDATPSTSGAAPPSPSRPEMAPPAPSEERPRAQDPVALATAMFHTAIELSPVFQSQGKIRALVAGTRELRVSQLAAYSTQAKEESLSVLGILTAKSDPLKSSKGELYVRWKLTDLRGDTSNPRASAALLLFGSVFKDHADIEEGTAILLRRPKVLPQTTTDQTTTLFIRDSRQLCPIGRAVHFGVCDAIRTSTGQRCTIKIDTSRGPTCEHHLMMAFRSSVLNRAELRVGPSSVRPDTGTRRQGRNSTLDVAHLAGPEAAGLKLLPDGQLVDLGTLAKNRAADAAAAHRSFEKFLEANPQMRRPAPAAELSYKRERTSLELSDPGSELNSRAFVPIIGGGLGPSVVGAHLSASGKSTPAKRPRTAPDAAPLIDLELPEVATDIAISQMAVATELGRRAVASNGPALFPAPDPSVPRTQAEALPADVRRSSSLDTAGRSRSSVVSNSVLLSAFERRRPAATASAVKASSGKSNPKEASSGATRDPSADALMKALGMDASLVKSAGSARSLQQDKINAEEKKQRDVVFNRLAKQERAYDRMRKVQFITVRAVFCPSVRFQTAATTITATHNHSHTQSQPHTHTHTLHMTVMHRYVDVLFICICAHVICPLAFLLPFRHPDHR
ncbi:hypothetical protein, variant [Fonticula alba]|uniref:Uncharacterized protein n=1 Tax=Fonticula alba TaxID=691883 RepID=A0A058Z4T0_FONAL|nr:hypothetical protein, variant [Fonticula alba]KCV69294.1 hypothetical protein, variant [Fonticula alba]|eukprot:XP_009495859.1 hypothetical protein, variant [Fonticula alba]